MDGRSRPWAEKMKNSKSYMEVISWLRRRGEGVGRGEICKFVGSITGKAEKESHTFAETIITAMLRNKDVTVNGDYILLAMEDGKMNDVIKMKMSSNLIFVEPSGKMYGGYLPFLNLDKVLGSSVQFTNSNGKLVQSTMIERWHLNFDSSVFEGVTVYLGE